MAGVAVLGAAFIGLVGGGALADAFLRRGRSPQFARARLPGISILAGLPFLLATPLVESTGASIGCLIVFALFFNAGLAGFSTVSVEYGRDQAGAIFGAVNMCAAFAAIFGPLTGGYVLGESGSNWAIAFAVSTAVAAVSGVILLALRVGPLRADDAPGGGPQRRGR